MMIDKNKVENELMLALGEDKNEVESKLDELLLAFGETDLNNKTLEEKKHLAIESIKDFIDKVVEVLKELWSSIKEFFDKLAENLLPGETIEEGAKRIEHMYKQNLRSNFHNQKLNIKSQVNVNMSLQRAPMIRNNL